MDPDIKKWLDNDYWRVYTGILGLSNYPTTPKIKKDFRQELEQLVNKYRKRLEKVSK